MDLDTITRALEGVRNTEQRRIVLLLLSGQYRYRIDDEGHAWLWRKAKRDRPRCGARCRDGHPCQATALENGRCRLHGGLSSGPKTPEGRERIAESNRRRAAARRITVE